MDGAFIKELLPSLQWPRTRGLQIATFAGHSCTLVVIDGTLWYSRNQGEHIKARRRFAPLQRLCGLRKGNHDG